MFQQVFSLILLSNCLSARVKKMVLYWSAYVLLFIGKPPDIAKWRVSFIGFLSVPLTLSLSSNLSIKVFFFLFLNPNWSSKFLTCNWLSDRIQWSAQCRAHNQVKEKCWPSNKVSEFLKPVGESFLCLGENECHEVSWTQCQIKLIPTV